MTCPDHFNFKIKVSLLLAALAVGMGASAQYQTCFMDMETLGFDDSAVIPSGTVLCQDENGTLCSLLTTP